MNLNIVPTAFVVRCNKALILDATMEAHVPTAGILTPPLSQRRGGDHRRADPPHHQRRVGRSLAAELRARGVPSARGAPWSAYSVRQIVIRGRNAGLREANGKITAPGNWPAIVSREE